MSMLSRVSWAGGAMLAIEVVGSCSTGASGAGWERSGWFGGDSGYDAGVDATSPFGGGGGGGGGNSPPAPTCGGKTCSLVETCVGGPSGPTCYPTCIIPLSCSSRCCATTLDNTGNTVQFCAPTKAYCCGDTGGSCQTDELCIGLKDGTEICAQKCAKSSDCTKTLCCGSLKDGSGACVPMTGLSGTCKP
jgi:hypothetical protein